MSVVKKTEFNAEGVGGQIWILIPSITRIFTFLESQTGGEEDQDEGEVWRSLAWETAFLRRTFLDRQNIMMISGDF